MNPETDGQLVEYLQSCTARITLGDGEVGTGTFVGPSMVVTSAHVARSASAKMLVSAGGINLDWEVLSISAVPFPDLALIRVSGDGHSWVRLDNSVSMGDRLYVFGYPPGYESGDSITLDYEGNSYLYPGGALLKLKGGQVQPGFSGAPVLNFNTAAVCGIVRTTRDRNHPTGGRASPVASLLAFVDSVDPSLGHEVLAEGSDTWPSSLGRNEERSVRPQSHRLVRGTLEPAEHFCGQTGPLGKLGEFWSAERDYVASLIGIGGSGKTALARQFLDMLYVGGAGAGYRDVDHFILWSFYDYPSTSGFIESLNSHFHDEANVGNTVDGVVKSIADAGRVVIVLDGLEKMQSPRTVGGSVRGALEDPPLRQLLLALVDGEAPGVKVIVTSRFGLTDLEARPRSGYVDIPVEDLDSASAEELLRRCGIEGPVGSLLLDYGRHALTLDLLGRLVAEFFHGDAMQLDRIGPLGGSSGSPGIEKQAARLSRVLSAYLEYLGANEVALMQGLSLFRRPVDAGFFADLLAHSESTELSGLGGTVSTSRIGHQMARLTSLRLVSVASGTTGSAFYDCHPAVKDFFHRSMSDAKALHGEVRDRLLSLVEAPGDDRVLDVANVERLEELIYHTVMLGEREHAFELYREKLGYLRLGWQRGDHARGVSVLRMIGDVGDGDVKRTWSVDQSVRFGIDFGLYLKNLGALEEARSELQAILNDVSQASLAVGKISASEHALVLQNLAAVLALSGRLPESEEVAREGVTIAEGQHEMRVVHDCRVRLASALAMQGETERAIEEFQRARDLGDLGGKVVREVLSVRYAELLLRTGAANDAVALLEEERVRYAGMEYGIIVARLDVALAVALADVGRVEEGLATLDEVFRWITRGVDHEMVIASHLARAKLALRGGDLVEAAERAGRAIRLAQRSGYSLHRIDALVVLGATKLADGWPEDALECSELALNSTAIDDRSEWLGSRDPKVNYFWGERDGAELRAQALAYEQPLGQRRSS